MIYVSRISSTPNSLRQHQFHLGTHLALYPIQQMNSLSTKTDKGNFQHFLEIKKDNRTVISLPSTKEFQLMEQRQDFIMNEELLQKLNYQNGVHYSVRIKELATQAKK